MADAICAQWTTSMTAMFAYPVRNAAQARRCFWPRCAPLVSARALRALHVVQCPVPRADFARSWRAEFLSCCNFRSKFAKRQLAGKQTSNEINSLLSHARIKLDFARQKNGLYTFVYVCASGFVAEWPTRLTKHTPRTSRPAGVVALRASNVRLQPMMKFHPLSFRRTRGLPDDH
jgi:hypothetical protein